MEQTPSEEAMLPSKVPFDPTPERKNPLTNQLAYLKKNILPSIIKQNLSWPFRKPVDFEALKLYDYPSVIRRPMDLSTITKRLNHGWYSSSADCIADFDLMMKNCVTYNRPHDDVTQMAESLSKFFYEKLKKMPPEEMTLSDSRKRDSVKVKTEVERPPAVKKTRFSMAVQKRCFIIICDFFDPKNAEFAEPFYHPVDTARFPDYPNLIANPMDLSMVKRNVETLKYQSFMDFAHDVRLIFSNCYLYNVAGSEIYKKAQLLQRLYEDIVVETSRHYRSEENISLVIRTLEEKIKMLEDEISSSDGEARRQSSSSERSKQSSQHQDSGEEREYSYADRRRISGMVTGKLPSEELLNIIKMCNGDSVFASSTTSEELVIDFYRLKNSTLRKIESYVENYVRQHENKRKYAHIEERKRLIQQELSQVRSQLGSVPKKPKSEEETRPVMSEPTRLSDESSDEDYFDESDLDLG